MMIVTKPEKSTNKGEMAADQQFLLLAAAVVAAAAAAAGVEEVINSLPGCPSRCGKVDVPYPYGFLDGCYREGFRLTCEDNAKLLYGGFEVLSIDIIQGEMRATMPAGQYCFIENGVPRSKIDTSSADVRGSFLTFSSRNMFTVIGCDTEVLFAAPSQGFTTGCISVCGESSPLQNDTCKGVGCCQTSIPKGLKYYAAVFKSFNNYTRIFDFNRCSYAFLVEQGAFSFNTTILRTEYNYGDLRLPMVFDWIVQDNGKNCDAARTNLTSYACRSSNSVCLDSSGRELDPSRGPGYLCNCSSGYQGNPYILDGCKDIDECKNPEKYPCRGICINTPGDYSCTCEPGTRSDNPRLADCIPVTASNGSNLPLAVKWLIGLGSGVLFIIVVGSWAYWGLQKRKMIKLKQAFFKQNGGLFLQQQINSYQASSFKIFTMIELEKATDNFDQKQVIGRGGQGTVYKGKLEDGRVVAIKRSLMISESKSREFAKEMLILSQVNHINVVKLLGCCLEAEVPMLVYEYIPNGTLFHFIHEKRKEFLISFGTRLRIAAETAEALAYLHSAASPPILHGDVKSSNILLDNNYRAKVSDFGTSVLAANNRSEFTTVVQGTCGYLDPEYLQTCQLTEKSDVYSFAVVLIELLTGKKALYFGESEDDRSLAVKFITCKSENRLEQILDPQIMGEGGMSNELRDVSELAVQCLRVKGDERPTMKEVLVELDALRRSDKHPWIQHNQEETESLLIEAPDSTSYDTTGCLASLEVGMEAGR